MGCEPDLGLARLGLVLAFGDGDSARPDLLLGHDTDDDGFHCCASLMTRSTSAKKSSSVPDLHPATALLLQNTTVQIKGRFEADV